MQTELFCPLEIQNGKLLFECVDITRKENLTSLHYIFPLISPNSIQVGVFWAKNVILGSVSCVEIRLDSTVGKRDFKQRGDIGALHVTRLVYWWVLYRIHETWRGLKNLIKCTRVECSFSASLVRPEIYNYVVF